MDQVKSSLSADRVGGLIWFVFGAAVVYGSWTMDRLEQLNIPPSTAPGVVPGLLGICIIAFALTLMLRSERAAEAPVAFPHAHETHDQPIQWKRVGLSWTLCMIYGALLLGGGVPYGPLTGVFLFLHLTLLDETEQVPARPNLRRFLFAVILAASVATAVSLVFRYLFLVRLP
jgi:hypothetical protein